MLIQHQQRKSGLSEEQEEGKHNPNFNFWSTLFVKSSLIKTLPPFCNVVFDFFCAIPVSRTQKSIELLIQKLMANQEVSNLMKNLHVHL